MGISPPKPGFENRALSTIRRLQWSPVSGDVGELKGGWIAIAADEGFDALWVIGEQAAPAGIAPRLLTKEAFTALREGQLTQDGAIQWGGRSYRLCDVWDGKRHVARLVAA